MPQLYEIPEGSLLRIETSDEIKDAKFFHLDGAYSYCETEDGEPFHLSGSTPLKLVKGRFEIDNNDKLL